MWLRGRGRKSAWGFVWGLEAKNWGLNGVCRTRIPLKLAVYLQSMGFMGFLSPFRNDLWNLLFHDEQGIS